MKNTTLILVALIGSVASGYGVDLVNTNIVGPSTYFTSTGRDPIENPETYTITDASGSSYNIVNSSITAAGGKSVTSVAAQLHAYALGTGGMRSTGAAHDIDVVDSVIAGSSGGSITDSVSQRKYYNVNGGNGMYLENTSLRLLDSIISGGDAGTIQGTNAHEASTAIGGFGIQFLGISSLTATNGTISGGKGGRINLENRTGIVNGGAGISITGSATVDLNLVDTTVYGGAGGVVQQNLNNLGSATGGDALLITGGANVTINSGTYVAGAGGSVAGVQQAKGNAVQIQGSTVTIAGGDFVGDILLSSGTSTLSIKDTFTDDPRFWQTGGMVTFNEWYDGQLKDILLTAGTMNFANSAFNLDGVFTVAGASASSATAKFNSGLNVKSGGVLDLGRSTSTAAGAHLEAGSLVEATRNGTALGKLQSSAGLTVDNGAKWVINDIGTSAFGLGQVFTLATSTGTISNNLDAADVFYNGANGSSGWLGLITNVYVSGNNLNAVYGQKEINEVLGVDGDNSEFGQAMADLSMLVSQTNTTVYGALGDITPYLSEAKVIMSNGYIRVPEVAHAIVGLQSIFMDQVKDRSRSNLHESQVGYPAVASPAGAGGWDWLRGLSDRMESGLNADSMRGVADRSEGLVDYNQIKGAMDSLTSEAELEDVELPPMWQVWGRGYGSNVKQDSRNGFAGYDADIGGGILGIDKRINNVLLGVGGGYAHTELAGYEYNDALIDTGHAIVYLSMHGDHLFFDLNLDGAISSVETKMQPLGYKASFDALSAGLYAGGGVAMPLTDYLVLTPEASLLMTYYSHDSYNETSSLALPTKQHDSYDQVTPVSTLGATLALVRKIDFSRYEVAVQPEIRGHWLHDFNAEMDDESYTLVGGVNSISTPLMATEEDLYKIGAGVRFAQWASDSTEVGVDFDYTYGDDYEAYVVSGKVIHRF